MTKDKIKNEDITEKKEEKEEKEAPAVKNEDVQAFENEDVQAVEIEQKNIQKQTAVKDGTDIFDDNESINFSENKEDKEVSPGEEKPKKDDKGAKKIKKGKKKKKKKEFKKVVTGRAYIQASYNNTIIALTDQTGATLAIGSAGQLGFKGPKKATPYASSIVVRDLVNKVKTYGLQYVSVYVKGVGAGREAAVRALNANGLNIIAIKDQTPVPHNGCRPKKRRRV